MRDLIGSNPRSRAGRLAEIRSTVDSLSGRREAFRSLLAETGTDMVALETRKADIDRAALIIRNVAESTQRMLQARISELATMAEAAVFRNPYEAKVEFVQRRGQTEADIKFERGGLSIDPLESGGHGAADIASLAFQISLWLLARKRTRPVFILDEPFKNLNGAEHQEATWRMVRMLADRLGIQFIIITQIEGLENVADRSFHVSMKAGASQVTVREAR